ncbi:hypothetical protein ACE1TH_13400 [Shouchella sp. JSM 1781072]|uniref:hypothetical protein n=1 Tax=Shouchella sp. JSM 1781072 TaxID=3344581 RepID=UPI0035BFE8B0
MHIIDTVPDFLAKNVHSLMTLKDYHRTYPDAFKEYFSYHCPSTEERFKQALQRYLNDLPHIKTVHQQLPSILETINTRYKERYELSFKQHIYFIVGAYSSNAFTHRQITPDITFALEQLPQHHDGLRVLAAHEFGHALHQTWTDTAGMDWSHVQWDNHLLSLYREGVATHFSREIVPDAPPHIYFTFGSDYLGNESWLAFAQENEQTLKSAFYMDYQQLSPQEVFREWFSINGGKRFGYTRLAYFLADRFFQQKRKKTGEREAILAWRDPFFLKEIEKWLRDA